MKNIVNVFELSGVAFRLSTPYGGLVVFIVTEISPVDANGVRCLTSTFWRQIRQTDILNLAVVLSELFNRIQRDSDGDRS